ncbi:uncharacterized protein LOC143284881 isoform X2 [Babylonia areolata]|uniref:uncharacterized protein LOC143284881 isoform X2 n=1 Tax=Babylonia areolata TaxID=304850 RepID=UPI003FD47B3F
MSIRLRIEAVRGSYVSADHLHSGQDAANSDTDAHDIPVPDDVTIRTPQSYPGCFGLPYQDHNYGAQPPMSPPPPPPRSPTPPPPTVNGSAEVEEETKVPAVSNEEEVMEDSITRCICGFLHDDGYMICCDKCSVWQHIDCMEIDRNNIPESYCCEICEPRELDVERARMIQLRRKEEIASLGRKPVQPKPKGSKQRRVSKTGTRLLKTGRLSKSQQLKRDKKLKLTKKEKENMRDALKKQKIGKTGVPKEKKMKKKLNTSLTQNKAEFWNRLEPLFSVYGAQENEYSPEIVEFLSHVKTNGVHSPHSIGVFPEELLVQLYKVSEIKKNIKGLEATQLIVPGKAVIEFKGRVMLRQHYLPDPHLDQSQPYVLYYSKFEGLDLCIDASAFGGDARFIRRSCAPNAEMCHIIDNGNLHFIVQAKKEIPKGVEITIPFDFNYQELSTYIECACGRISCPVAKFWKKVKLGQKSPEKTKRKRQASGEGRVRRNSQGKGSPVKVTSSGSKSPSKYSPTKNSTGVPPVLSLSESTEAVDVTAPVDNELDFPPVVKPAAVPRRSCRASADVKEERDIKPAKLPHCKEPVKAAAQENVPDLDVHHGPTMESSSHPVSETEADSTGESHRKLTREERKMEAIMKAFEKMEKREERRKEALARLDKKHVDHIKEEPVDRSQVLEPCSGSYSDPVVDSIVDQTSQSPVTPTSQLPEADVKVVVKLEEPAPTVVESPQRSARQKRIKRKRRNSRVMSAIEPLYTSPPRPPVAPRPTMPSSTNVFPSAVEEIKEEPMEPVPVSCVNLPTAPCVEPLPSVMEDTPAYVFNKKRKYLFSDMSGSRSPEGPVRDEEMFVSCAPGPRSSMEHIQRRNSTSAAYGRMSDSNKGNAKKRWLRQAMYETVPLRVETGGLSPRPASTDSCSPPITSTYTATPGPTATITSATAPCLHSPTGSPSDFVTPLKKRRLAPEFLPSASAAAQATPVSEESTCHVLSPVSAESTAASSTITSPATGDSLPRDRVWITPSQEKRPRMKGTCLFGRKKGNGLLVPTSSSNSACDEPVPGSSGYSVVASAGSDIDSLLDPMSCSEVLSPSCSLQTGSCASAGSSASSTVGTAADSAEGTMEGRQHSPGPSASTSLAACVIRHLEPILEVPLVDSSDAAVDTGQVRDSPQGTSNSDSLGVCSSNNEVSTACVNSADSDCQEDRCFRKDVVMAESCSVASSGRSYALQDQDEDVSESQPLSDHVEEDEGNEASGSVSVSEELSRHSENISCAVPQPTADCQVNSSQDLLSCSRMAAGRSPSQEENKRRLSLQSLLVVDRTEDSHSGSADGSERAGVSSAQDSSPGERERSGVSSAKDISAVSSVVSMLGETDMSSDMECGPSSSTQASHSHPVDTLDTMVCNSSDVTGSSAISFVCEDSNVDSTTQSGCVVRVDLNQCDTADSGLQAAESEESCCDSNSDEQAEHGVGRDGGSVSSSGPADSQGDDGMDSGQGGVSTSSCAMSCSTASVSSSHYSTSHTEVSLGTSVSSSVYSSVQVDCAPGHPVAHLASTSTLFTTDCSELSGPSQSSCQQGHTLPTSRADHLSSQQCGGPELDGVDSSEQASNSPFPAAEQCEASTSSSTTDRLPSEDGDTSTRPVSSSLLQTPADVDLAVSSGGVDGGEDRVVVNGSQLHGSMVSSFSEDSSGSSCTNPSATVSSSEAQAAPIAKRKVSLSEYRSRRKDKTGCAASTSSATSPMSSTEPNTLINRAYADHCISLAPLPLFEPITIRDNREHKDEKEKRMKPMSLSDRLRIEFGLETSEEDEKDSSTGSLKTSDIPPPPPPLPRNGKVGGVVGRRPGSVGGPQTSAENEEDGQHASSSTIAGRSSPSAGAAPADAERICHVMLSSWFSKLHSSHHSTAATVVEVAGPSALHQHPSSSPVFATVTATQSCLPQSFVSGTGGSQLPNGSHPPGPAAFSTAALYAASTSQGQPHGAQTFTASGKQQPARAPPPPPSTAYPPYLAQSRTHCLRAQTPPVGPRHADQQGPSGAVSPATSAPVGNGVAPSRHPPLVNSSSNHSHGRYHFSPFSHNDSVSHKGSYTSDRKRR